MHSTLSKNSRVKALFEKYCRVRVAVQLREVINNKFKHEVMEFCTAASADSFHQESQTIAKLKGRVAQIKFLFMIKTIMLNYSTIAVSLCAYKSLTLCADIAYLYYFELMARDFGFHCL